MSDRLRLPSRPPPIPLASRPRAVSAPNGSETPNTYASAANGTIVALDALQDLLEALDMLPCVKYVAGVVVKILQVIDVGYISFLILMM